MSRFQHKVKCNNCGHDIVVDFDSEYLCEDGKKGDFVLNGVSCWNCGLAYSIIFSPNFVDEKTKQQKPFPIRAMK